jgi:hypothetical protein
LGVLVIGRVDIVVLRFSKHQQLRSRCGIPKSPR